MDSLSLYRSEEAFGYAPGINLGLEGIRRLEKAEGVCNVCLSCVSMKGVKKEEKSTISCMAYQKPISGTAQPQ